MAIPALPQSLDFPKMEPVAPLPKKKVLAIGAVKGFQHDSTSHALATIERMGRVSGLWETYIRTDTQLLTKQRLTGNAKNLNWFDVVIFYTTGELDMDDQQKADFMAFIKEDGKGFLGVHSAADTFYKWPEYGEMIGGYFDLHPWNTFDAPVTVEEKDNPIVKHFPVAFIKRDEIYQFKAYSRDKVRVLMSLDPAKVDLTNKNVRRQDKDFAVAWVREYGKGRVFYSTLGHTHEAWDDPQVQKMWFEAIKWTLRLSDGVDVAPKPKTE
jgi:type 1 glutamine amidotransferase